MKNSKVAVTGSGITGLETAEILSEAGNIITVFEMADDIAPGAYFQLKDDEMSRLIGKAEFKTGRRLVSIKENCFIIENVKTKEMEKYDVDNVVLSLGVRPVNALANELKANMRRVYTVGDAVKSGIIEDAVHSGFDTVLMVR